MIEKQTNGFVSVIENKPKDFWLKLMVKKELITKEKGEKKLVRNEILGYTTPKEIERAIELKAIKRIRDGNLVHYAITTDEKIINGKKELVVSQAYLDYEKRKRSQQGANYYKTQEMNALIRQKEMDEALKEIDEIFPNSVIV